MLINNEQLKEWTGYERPADIRRWLDKHRILWLPTKDGVCTTLKWIESSQEEQDNSPEGLF